MISLALGVFVGILLALTGAGGSVVAVPLLVFTLHLSIAEASPLGLLAVMLAAGVGAVLGLRAGTVRYKAAGLIAACGVLSVPVGIWLAQRLPNVWLTLLFVVVLAFVAIRMLRQSGHEPDTIGWADDRSPLCEIDQMRGKLRWTAPCARSIMVAGMGAGFLSGLLGVGGGFVIVPALRSFTNLDIKSIVATSLAAIALVSAVGVVVAAWHGLVNWEYAWSFASGAGLGMLAGRRMVRHLTGRRIQQMFAVFALMVSLGLLLRML